MIPFPCFVALTTIILICPNVLGSTGFRISEVTSVSHNIPRGGPASLARAYTKYGLPISRSLEDAVHAADAHVKGQIGGASADLVDYEIMYSTPISIGGQEFNMQFDTGSSAIWVYSTFTPEAMRGPNRHVYNPSISSTSKIILNVTLEEHYGGGGNYVSGPAYTDMMEVGSLIVPSQAFGLAVNVSADFYNNSALDGIVGLSAYSGGSAGFTPQKQPTFLETVLPTLKHRLFTAFLNRGSGGFYTFGYIPDFYPPSSLTWVNSTSDWSTTITGLAIGNRSNMKSTNLGPIVDTGTPFLLLPPEYCVEYYSSLGSFQLGSYHGESGFVYPCNATLPDLYLQIGEYTATIKGEQLSGPEASDGFCWGHLQPIAGLNVPSAILGDTFLQSTFTVFKIPKIGPPMLGFAPKEMNCEYWKPN